MLRRWGLVTLIVTCALVGLAERVYACAAVRGTARLDTFTCASCPGGNLETQIYVVTGQAVVSTNHTGSILGNVVVELQARENGVYSPVARQVANAYGASSVETCSGTMTAGPNAGGITFLDSNSNEVGFDPIKNIPEGTSAISYVATFIGTMPALDPGERARVRTYTTAMNVPNAITCSVDADGNGSIDSDVKTLIFQKLVRVPTTSFLLTP